MRYLALLVMLFGPTPAYAETITWDAADDGGIPKGVVGADGIRCIGEATQGGNTVRLRNYVGADAGMMATDPARERAWQRGECQRIMEMDLPMLFAYYWSITLDKAAIRVTVERL